MWRPLAVFATILASPPQAGLAASLQPTGKWEVEYTATTCTAKRKFGDVTVSVSPAPLGQTVNLVIVGPGQADQFARQYSSTIDPGDGGAPIRATTMVYPVRAKGRVAMTTIISLQEADRIGRGSRLRFATTRALSRQMRYPTRLQKSQVQLTADVQLAVTPALGKAMTACGDDLRKQWGMVDGKLAKPAVRTIGDMRSIFKDDDYPLDAWEADSTGTSQYLVMVDEQGLPMDCVVIQSSGVASLDAMGCQVIRERAKFIPARDAQGKAVKDMYVTPPIRWNLYGPGPKPKSKK